MVVEELVRHSELSMVDGVDVVAVVAPEATRNFCAEKNVGQERRCSGCCCDRD